MKTPILVDADDIPVLQAIRPVLNDLYTEEELTQAALNGLGELLKDAKDEKRISEDDPRLIKIGIALMRVASNELEKKLAK